MCLINISILAQNKKGSEKYSLSPYRFSLATVRLLYELKQNHCLKKQILKWWSGGPGEFIQPFGIKAFDISRT